VRFGTREGEHFNVPGGIAEPRLVLVWEGGVMEGDVTGDDYVDRQDLALVLAELRERAQVGPGLDVDFNSLP